MSARELPSRPSLDHLRHEAKALYKAYQSGDAAAIERVRITLGDAPLTKLTDAQRGVARDYGFPTWARLRAHVQAARDLEAAADEFLSAVGRQDIEGARRTLTAHPRIAAANLRVAATLGSAGDVQRLLDESSLRVEEQARRPVDDALRFVCYSPFHRESEARDAALLATARMLLDRGADPNSRDGRYNVPVLYAVTGVRSVVPIARLLLDAGANPTDGESVFHAAEHFHEDALELLLAAGADLNEVGDWGNTPLYFLVRWWNMRRHPRVDRGMRWLLARGADPNVVSGKDRETALHGAVRCGQAPDIITLLLAHGADVHARRGDGSTPWLLARRAGFEDVAAVLERAGAERTVLSVGDALVAACGAGDANAARALSTPALRKSVETIAHPLFIEAAERGREAVVAAFLAAGFSPDTTDGNGATVLHHSAIHGHAAQVRTLLAAGSDTTIIDREYESAPLGWAFFGADVLRDAGADYEGCVRALLEGGATVRDAEHAPEDASIRRIVEEFSKRS